VVSTDFTAITKFHHEAPQASLCLDERLPDIAQEAGYSNIAIRQGFQIRVNAVPDLPLEDHLQPSSLKSAHRNLSADQDKPVFHRWIPLKSKENRS
jgi:hypothetical protein